MARPTHKQLSFVLKICPAIQILDKCNVFILFLDCTSIISFTTMYVFLWQKMRRTYIIIPQKILLSHRKPFLTMSFCYLSASGCIQQGKYDTTTQRPTTQAKRKSTRFQQIRQS